MSRGTRMTLHFMEWKLAHQSKIVQWQTDRERPYWRRAPQQLHPPVPMPTARRALAYSGSSTKASAAEGAVVFHRREVAYSLLLEIGFTSRQARRMVKKHWHGVDRQGARPVLTVVDEARRLDGTAR